MTYKLEYSATTEVNLGLRLDWLCPTVGGHSGAVIYVNYLLFKDKLLTSKTTIDVKLLSAIEFQHKLFLQIELKCVSRLLDRVIHRPPYLSDLIPIRGTFENKEKLVNDIITDIDAFAQHIITHPRDGKTYLKLNTALLIGTDDKFNPCSLTYSYAYENIIK